MLAQALYPSTTPVAPHNKTPALSSSHLHITVLYWLTAPRLHARTRLFPSFASTYTVSLRHRPGYIDDLVWSTPVAGQAGAATGDDTQATSERRAVMGDDLLLGLFWSLFLFSFFFCRFQSLCCSLLLFVLPGSRLGLTRHYKHRRCVRYLVSFTTFCCLDCRRWPGLQWRNMPLSTFYPPFQCTLYHSAVFAGIIDFPPLQTFRDTPSDRLATSQHNTYLLQTIV